MKSLGVEPLTYSDFIKEPIKTKNTK